MKTRLLIFDYNVSDEGNVTFHGIDFDHQTHARLGHRVIQIADIPFIFHQGPFKTEGDARKMAEAVLNVLKGSGEDFEDLGWALCSTQPRHTNKAVLENTTVNAFKGPPIAYMNNALQTASHWIEYSWVSLNVDRSFEKTRQFTIVTNVIKEFAKQKYKNELGTLWLTDRSCGDSVLRCLAPYTIPGFFTLTNKAATNNGAYVAPQSVVMRWSSFRANVLETQLEADREQVVLALDDPKPLLFNVAVISTERPTIAPQPTATIGKGGSHGGGGNGPKGGQTAATIAKRNKRIFIHQINLNEWKTISVDSMSVSDYEQKIHQNPALVDLVLIGVPQPELDQIHASLITKQRKEDEQRLEKDSKRKKIPTAADQGKHKKKFADGLAIALHKMHQVVVNNLQLRGIGFLPYGTLVYQTRPFFIVPFTEPTPDVLADPDNFDAFMSAGWEHDVNVCSFLLSLVLKARVTGRNWNFLTSPLGAETTSRRTESLLMRHLLRSNYTVFPPNELIPLDGKDETATDQMRRLAQSVKFDGGLNIPMLPQQIASPEMFVNLDFVSFYGGLIATAKIDMCNPELWVMYETELRKLDPLIAEQRQDIGQGEVAHLMPRIIDTRTIAKKWLATWKNKVEQSGKTPDELHDAYDWSSVPFANYIRKFLTLRQSMQRALASGVEEDGTEMSGARKQSLKEMIEFLKNTTSAAYGAIGYDNNRFYYPPLSTLVTLIGQTIITESSEFIQAIPKSGVLTQVMNVTDSLGFRIKTTDRGLMNTLIERFRTGMLNKTYGRYLQVKADDSHAVLIVVTNNYATVSTGPDPRLEVKGLASRKGETPQVVGKFLELVLKKFLLATPFNLRFEDVTAAVTSNSNTQSKVDREGFVELLTKCLNEACAEYEGGRIFGRNRVGQVPDHTAGNTKFYVCMGDGNAIRQHFQFEATESKEVSKVEKELIEVHKLLKRVHGCVVSCSGDDERGTILSPTRPITVAAWKSFYLDFSIRQNLLDIFGAVFNYEDVDTAVCNVFTELNRIDGWVGKRVLRGGNSKAKRDYASAQASFAYLEKITKVAFEEREYEEYIAPILVAQTREEIDAELEARRQRQVETAAASPQTVTPSLMTEDDEATLDAMVMDINLETDVTMENGSDSGEDEKASATITTTTTTTTTTQITQQQKLMDSIKERMKLKKRKQQKKNKPKGAPNPLKVAQPNPTLEFVWMFNLTCRTCGKPTTSEFGDNNKGNEVGANDPSRNFFMGNKSAANLAICIHCKKSIHGDFLSSANASSARTITLQCFRAMDKTPFSFMSKTDAGGAPIDFVVLRDNWRSLDRLKEHLLKLLVNDLPNQLQFKESLSIGDLVTTGLISGESLLSTTGQRKELLLNPREQNLLSLFIDVVLSHIGSHPYTC